MASEFNTPFEVYRANLGVALRMFALAEEWRQHACELEKLRIERDVDALRRMRESATTAKNWDEYQAGFQAMLRDYFATTSNIWQQGMGLAIRNRDALGEGVRDALNSWQSAWADQWQKTAEVSGSGAPVQEWLQHLEQAIAAGSGVREVAQTAAQPQASQPQAVQPVGTAAARARRRLVRGE